jgi:hypothetical protein
MVIMTKSLRKEWITANFERLPEEVQEAIVALMKAALDYNGRLGGGHGCPRLQ